MRTKRIVLLTVAALLCVSALLAIAILLVGRFGSTEGRILGTNALLAGFGLVALPAFVLLDEGRARRVAQIGIGLAAVAAALALSAIWSRTGSDAFGRVVGTATIAAVAWCQASALTVRRTARDPGAVRRLFAASCGTAALAATFAVVLLWVDPHGSAGPRALGAIVVVDLLLVVLQPLLARTRAREPVHRLEVVLASGERIDVSIHGGDLASAAARAIRSAERQGGRIAQLEVRDGDGAFDARSGAGVEPTKRRVTPPDAF